MGNFSEQPPSNLGPGTTESDPVAGLFNSAYVFGEPVYPIEQTPGPSDVGPSEPTTEPPIDVTSEPAPPPSPVARIGGGAQWYLWPSDKTSLTISLPHGGDVRSLWFPNLAFDVAISPAQAPGSIMYAVTSPGAELVSLPAQSRTVSLSTITPATHPPMWVFATSDVFAPSRSSSGAQPYVMTALANGFTACPGLGGAPATQLVGVLNSSSSAQTARLIVYDSSVNNDTNHVVAWIAPLGPSQILTFPPPGIPLSNGCQVFNEGADLLDYVQILTR